MSFRIQIPVLGLCAMESTDSEDEWAELDDGGEAYRDYVRSEKAKEHLRKHPAPLDAEEERMRTQASERISRYGGKRLPDWVFRQEALERMEEQRAKKRARSEAKKKLVHRVMNNKKRR